jgi:hypothetical protein
MYGKSGNPSSRLSLCQTQEKQTMGKLNETIAEPPMQTTIAADDDHAMQAHIHHFVVCATDERNVAQTTVITLFPQGKHG